jgi:ribosomal protein S18 acetylase RimI-like enzyme
MELRYATTTDAEKIGQFARQAFYDSYAWYNDEQDMSAYLSNNFTAAQIAADINDSQTVYLIVLENNALCGYAKLAWRNRPDVTITGEKQLEIARFYAGKQFIGKGVGKLMMEASIAYAAQHNATVVWLDVWKENKHAIQFYTKWGFEIVSDWTFMLGNDLQEDYIMAKQLG